MIGENYLQLKVVLEHTYPKVVEDKPAMTSQSMFSSLGGTLNLWLGLNVMFAIEIIELVANLIRDRYFLHATRKRVTEVAEVAEAAETAETAPA